MALSEELQQIHESGDVGMTIDGMALRAKELEDDFRNVLESYWYIASVYAKNDFNDDKSRSTKLINSMLEKYNFK